MSYIRDFTSQPPRAIAWEMVALVAIVILASLATLVFSGAGAGLSFDGRPEQLPLPLPF